MNLDSEYILYTMTRIKTDKSIISFIDIVDRKLIKGHTRVKNWQGY